MKYLSICILSFLLMVLAACQTTDVSPQPSPQPETGSLLKAVIKASTLEGKAPLSIQFDASNSTGIDATTDRASWDFGEGAGFSATGFKQDHVFSQAGTFTVSLKVQAQLKGQSLQDETSVTIRVLAETEPDPSARVKPEVALALSLERQQLEQSRAELGIDAVAFATTQSGVTTLVSTGTISQSANGSFSYVSDRTDALELKFSDSSSLTYRFQNLNFDLSQPDGQRALRKDHNLSFRLETSEGTKVDISLIQQRGVYQKTIKGILVKDGLAFTVNTLTQGNVISDINPPGVDFEVKESISGSITATGFSLELNETFAYHLVIFDNAIEDVKHQFNNRWTLEGKSFSLPNGLIRRIFKNAKPVELDNWTISGDVLLNGSERVGGLNLEQTVSSLDTVLTIEDQKRILFSDKTF